MYDETPRTYPVKATTIASRDASFPDLLRRIADMVDEEPEKFPKPAQVELREVLHGRFATLFHE